MLKSERNNQRETTETNAPRELCNELAAAFGGGAFISQRKTLEWSFCTFERKRKKLFTDLRGIRSTCGAEE